MGIKRLQAFILQPKHIAPLIIFRIGFGALLFISILRFVLKGWVLQLYIAPKLFFPYYGFEWVQPLHGVWMYFIFGLLLLSSLGILFGALYRWSSILFFTLFTYIELIDKTNYLNHYYFISLIAFILIFLPANAALSLDNKWYKKVEVKTIPYFYILLLQLQLAITYIFAGIAKINADWLLEALPLKIWLPAFTHYPIIGQFMEMKSVGYLFSWFACIYDLTIIFFLFKRRTAGFAYILVLLFHFATAIFFNIGMFPYIMIVCTSIFLKTEWHEWALQKLKKITAYQPSSYKNLELSSSIIRKLFIFYFCIQVIMPLRYLFYPGHLFWTEQGYRFSWRVMLMEKAGTCFFFVKDSKTKQTIEIDNKKYLSYMQEKQMATQPDMLIDYAKFLKKTYEAKGFLNPSVNALCFVTLNGRPSRLFINDTIDLSQQSNSIFKNKSWIKPY